MTVADFCAAKNEGLIIVDRKYQRNSKVWPKEAQSYLIETICLDYPVPKLSLNQVTDLNSRKTVKHIVDGQQRSEAICGFFNNELYLSANLETKELREKTYEDIPPLYQQRFLSYALSIDLYLGATESEVIETFRRYNSYTVPLNAEEERHARFQGPFKWFINELSSELGTTFRDLGVLTETKIIRMQDTKLLSELCHALQFGIDTTTKAKLRALYERYNKTFTKRSDYHRRIVNAINVTREFLSGGKLKNIAKPHNYYSLVLATMHAQDPVDTLLDIAEYRPLQKSRARIREALQRLDEAVDKRNPSGEFEDLYDASDTKTNVKSQREVRFEYFFDAVTGRLK